MPSVSQRSSHLVSRPSSEGCCGMSAMRSPSRGFVLPSRGGGVIVAKGLSDNVRQHGGKFRERGGRFRKRSDCFRKSRGRCRRTGGGARTARNQLKTGREPFQRRAEASVNP